jgi:hypothetical protein
VKFKELLYLYCKAIGMEVCLEKSFISFNGLSKGKQREIIREILLISIMALNTCDFF